MLYGLLPFKVDYAPYTVEHVVTQLQLLFFSALAFTVLMRTGLYPPELCSINLDFDWFYRRLGYDVAVATGRGLQRLWDEFVDMIGDAARGVVRGVYRHHGPGGALARSWPTGEMAFWTTVLLAAYLLLSYLSY
jgi:multicomponent Na+:H+ antiporter subunit D